MLLLVGYISYIPFILALGIIVVNKLVLNYTKFFSNYVLELVSFSVALVGIIYGYVVGFFFALLVPMLISMLVYSIVRKKGSDLIPANLFSIENISYIIISTLASFLLFIPFTILIVLLIGLKFTICAIKDIAENKIPNLLAISITLIVSFYLAQFLESYVIIFL